MQSTEIIYVGDPRLRVRSSEILTSEITSTPIQDLIKTLISEMRSHQSVGIAAPQIGINKRLFVYEVNNNPRRPDALKIPLTVLINPEFEVLDDEIEEAYEGCLSVPGKLMAKVPRATKIRYRGYDAEGRQQEQEAEGLHARIIQHETDHLDGTLFIDKVLNTKSYAVHDTLISD